MLGSPPGVVEKRNFLLYHRPNTSAHVNSPAYDFQGVGREGATNVVRRVSIGGLKEHRRAKQRAIWIISSFTLTVG